MAVIDNPSSKSANKQECVSAGSSDIDLSTETISSKPASALVTGLLGGFAALLSPACTGVNELHSTGYAPTSDLSGMSLRSSHPGVVGAIANSPGPSEMPLPLETPRSVSSSDRGLLGLLGRAGEKAVTRPFRNLERLTDPDVLKETVSDGVLKLLQREAMRSHRREALDRSVYEIDPLESAQYSYVHSSSMQDSPNYGLRQDFLGEYDPLRLHIPDIGLLSLDATQDRTDPVQFKMRIPSGRNWLDLATGEQKFSEFVNRLQYSFRMQMSPYDSFEVTCNDGFQGCTIEFVHTIGR